MWFSGQQACLACVGPQGAMLHWASKQPAKSYSYPQVMFPFTQMKAVRMPSRKKRENNAIVKGLRRSSRTCLEGIRTGEGNLVFYFELYSSLNSADLNPASSVIPMTAGGTLLCWISEWLWGLWNLSPVLVIVLFGWCKQTQLPTLLAPGFLHSGASTSQVSVCLCSFLKPARLSQPTGKAYQNFLWINYSPLFFHLLGFPTHTHVPSHLSDFGETLSCPFR